MNIKTHTHIISDDILQRIIRNAYNYGYESGKTDELCGYNNKSLGRQAAIKNARRMILKDEKKDYL